MTTSTEIQPKPIDRFARICTEVLAPWVWVLGLPLAVAWQATHHVWQALLWGLVVGITGSVIPMVVIVRGAKKGRWDSHHVTNREGRVVPFVACTSSLAAGIIVLLFGGAPSDMLALALAMFATLVVSVIITFGLSWKVSMHSAVAAGAVMILAIAYGPWLWFTMFAAVLVSWSRVRLGDHTAAQVTVGTGVGLLAGGFLYWWLAAALT
ncbi:phosphatase PAP2 family protein [Lentzea sp. BCCO 10_0798]|uniref:Phosphatase PAP2 family protein n=1 Tax=Lentzea kristufekii TaxID=3095430 RepID=A0ABU4TYV9_9PSEU|nr:phosphatase PAP2 family protein [Lentzea sp. BCCO 10_0798]MDX8053480.1 phosphatase PAP2 family protein [Lentzea sp. BCCO 10_0798]